MPWVQDVSHSRRQLFLFLLQCSIHFELACDFYSCMQTKAKALAAMCLYEWKQTLTKRRGHCCLCCTSGNEQNRVRGLSGDPGSCKPNVCVCVCATQWMGRWRGECARWNISIWVFLHGNPLIPAFGKACKRWFKTCTSERTRPPTLAHMHIKWPTSGSSAGLAVILMWHQQGLRGLSDRQM